MTTTTTRSLCLSLELNFEDERVAGLMEDEQGNCWPFSCWLDLLSLIERVQAGAPLPADHLERVKASNDKRRVQACDAAVGAVVE